MSNIRNIVNGGPEEPNKWWLWLTTTSKTAFTTGLGLGMWAYGNLRIVGWVIVTTGMITALPLMFEIKREEMVEEFEKMQIDAALAEGQTPRDLAMSGLTSAVEPKVL